MTHRRAPRLALWLLTRLVPDSEPLAGDLLEQCDHQRSLVWFWWQVMTAIAGAAFAARIEIRPLRLVDEQPADAVERFRRLTLRFPAVNLSASPVSGVGGLSVVLLAGVATVRMPVVWVFLLFSMLAGAALGILAISIRAAAAVQH